MPSVIATHSKCDHGCLKEQLEIRLLISCALEFLKADLNTDQGWGIHPTTGYQLSKANDSITNLVATDKNDQVKSARF